MSPFINLNMQLDDLSNYWGVDLIPKNYLKTISNKNVKSPRTLDLCVKACFPGFELNKLTMNGSDANINALLVATCGDYSTFLVGCGSYVSGDGGILQGFSSSCVDIINGMSRIAKTTKYMSHEGKHAVIPLPYHIPTSITSVDLSDLEDKCSKELLTRLILAKMKNNDVRCILIEPMLACNGAILSDTFYEIIATLATRFNFVVVLDEILTCGRITDMLLFYKLPATFQGVIAYVTVGKWIGCGLVLQNINNQYVKNIFKKSTKMTRRGYSTDIDTTNQTRMITYVSMNLVKIPVKRMKVLEVLGVLEEDAWGVGILIFCSVKKKSSIWSSHPLHALHCA